MDKDRVDRITENGKWPLLKTKPDGDTYKPKAKTQTADRRQEGAGRTSEPAGRSQGTGKSRTSQNRKGYRMYDREESRDRAEAAARRENRERRQARDGGRKRKSAGIKFDLADRLKFLKGFDRRILYGLLAALVLIIAAVAISRIAANAEKKRAAEELAASVATSSVEEAPVRTITPTDIKLTFVGDTVLGMDDSYDYDSSMNSYYDSLGADYFLENVRAVFQQDDLTIVNFEGALTDGDTRSDEDYAFKAPKEYIDIISSKSNASIELANVANEGTDDYGEEGYKDTISTLKSGGITPVGGEDVVVKEIKGVKIGVFAINAVDDLEGAVNLVSADIKKLKEQECDIIVANFHWGNELETAPDQKQVDLAHKAIDEGADLVVGHHPHVIQGIEYYQGKTIVYSVGNFLYGASANPTEIDTMIFQQTFSFNAKAEVTGTSINIIPCLESSNWTVNDYQPTIQTGDNGQYIIDKLNERSKEISEKYNTTTVYNSEKDGTVGFTDANPQSQTSSQSNEDTSAEESAEEDSENSEETEESYEDTGAEAGEGESETAE